MVILVSAPIKVSVSADGETYNINVSGGTVEDIISLAGITLGGSDYTERHQIPR